MALANLLIKIGADISELKTGSDKAVATMEKTGQKIDSIGSAIGRTMLAAFSVGAVVGWIDKTLSAASAIRDLADGLGISAEAVQRFKFAAEQSGATIDDIGKAINTMNKELAGADGGTVKALNDAGLSFAAIRGMSPEKAFLAVTEAVKNIKDPMLQAEVGTKLLGRSWLALSPAIKAGVAELGKVAPVMTNEVIASLEEAQQTWENLGNRVTIISGNMIAATVSVTSEITSSWRSFGTFVANSLQFGTGTAAALTGLAAAASKAGKATGKDIDLTPVLHKNKEELDKLADAHKKAAAAAAAYAKAFREGVNDMKGVTAIKAAEEALKRLNTATREGVPLQKMSRAAQDDLNQIMAAAIAVNGDASESIRKVYLATLDFSNMVIPLTHDYKKALIEAGDSYIPLISAQARWATSTADWPRIIQPAKIYIPIVGKIRKETDEWAESLAGVSNAFSQLAQIAGPSLSGILRGIGSVAAAFNVASQGMKAVKEGNAAGGASGKMGMIGGLATIASGYGAVAMAAIAAGKAIFKAMNDGRKAVVDFATSSGGFDDLRTKLLVLGDEGERLWKKLTQGTKKGDKAGAQGVIDEITAALDRQSTQAGVLNGAMEEYGFTWEDLGAQARGAKLGELFDTLFEKTQVLKGAGIDYDEILKRQSTDYSLLVQAAIRTGSEIPHAMQPVLQDLIEMGTLVDENGVAFADLGQVSWAKTLTQGFDQVTRAIYELTAALTDGIGGALDKLGQKKVTIPIKFDIDEMGRDLPGFAGGTHGRLLDFGPRGTAVMLHNREKIVTENEALGVDGGGDNYFVLNAGELWDKRAAKVARKDAARGGLRQRAAHGRSY